MDESGTGKSHCATISKTFGGRARMARTYHGHDGSHASVHTESTCCDYQQGSQRTRTNVRTHHNDGSRETHTPWMHRSWGGSRKKPSPRLTGIGPPTTTSARITAHEDGRRGAHHDDGAREPHMSGLRKLWPTVLGAETRKPLCACSKRRITGTSGLVITAGLWHEARTAAHVKGAAEAARIQGLGRGKHE